MEQPLELEAGPARVRVDPARGGRLASLAVAGHELLLGSSEGEHPIGWGCYPMAPWAGRIRHGRFTRAGVTHQVPVDLPPHAIHGTAYTSAWTVVTGPSPAGASPAGASPAGAAAGWAAPDSTSPAGAVVELALDVGDPWPWPARLTQRFALSPDRLRLELRLTAGPADGAAAPPMPAMVGWHPWFRRRVGGVPAELVVELGRRYELDGEGIPTGRLVAPGPGPWDDCFTGLARPPRLRWPGVADLELVSSCDHWVIFDRPEHALCVEPQTDAPDAVNRQPHLLAPGASLDAWFELRWTLAGP